MSKSHLLDALLIAALCAAAVLVARGGNRRASPSGAPSLTSVGPRLVSNQTSQPLALYGHGFAPGLRAELWDPSGRTKPVALHVMDAERAYARLSAADLDVAAPVAQAEFQVRLAGQASGPFLTVANDAHFVELTSLVAARTVPWVFAGSATTDTVFAIEPQAGQVKPLSAGDGPSALASWVDAKGEEWIVVAHRFSPELLLLTVDGSRRRSVPAPADASALAVDVQGTAYVAEQKTDTVVALSLADGRELWRSLVAPNPGSLALEGGRLWVGSLQAGVVEALEAATGKHLVQAAPSPTTSILGGHTEPFQKYVMGGTPVRALAASERLGVVFCASSGPNTGPNPERMEVTHNGGVGVVDASGAFARHLGHGAGVPSALALDEAAGRLYEADVGLGLVRVLDAARMSGTDAQARGAVVATVRIAPPADFPLLRPATDFGVNGRAGVELHSGPTALALSPDGKRLFVLNRFTGVLTLIDTAHEAVVGQVPVTPTLGQRVRRLGEVGYFADLGSTSMSCDACHVEGHTGGFFFEKTHPLRIYRSTTVRGARETAPYFTPASTFSIAQTIHDVGGRNRYHNPDPAALELEAMTTFTALIAALPNPYVGPDGAPPRVVPLPDRRAGRPSEGAKLFDAACASCHPPPLFTTDQDPLTRGHYLDVGTPKLMPLRPDLQEGTFPKASVPSLLGAWDTFPMLTTATAGLAVGRNEQVQISSRFALREVVEKYSGPAHGNAQALTPEQRDDLLAYLLTL